MADTSPDAPEEFTAFAVVEAATGGKVVVGMSDPGPEQVGAICRYVRADTIAALRAELAETKASASISDALFSEQRAHAAKLLDQIAALRAAPVAMREAIKAYVAANEGMHIEPLQAAWEKLREIAALPLDTPAPVDPVAEARIAAFLKDRDDALGVTEYHTDEERAESARLIAALAQEVRHD
jgi:hypothetical protein